MTTKTYDNLNRLTSIVSATNGVAVASYGYQMNHANQRTSITNLDSSRWVYQYDELGQVTSGKKLISTLEKLRGGLSQKMDPIHQRKEYFCGPMRSGIFEFFSNKPGCRRVGFKNS